MKIFQKGNEDSMQAALATLLSSPYEYIPNFEQPGVKPLHQFIKEDAPGFGYGGVLYNDPGVIPELHLSVLKNYKGVAGYFLATVKSPQYHEEGITQNVIIDSNFNILHDPNPRNANVKKYPDADALGFNGILQVHLISREFIARCSSAFKLMSEPKLVEEKKSGALSKTAKTYINEVWLCDMYGYEEYVENNEILKGKLNEQDAFTLVKNQLGGTFRNASKEFLHNEYIKGTPDSILPEEDVVEDVKNSYTVKTFFNARKNNEEIYKAYYWQGQCYMKLTGLKNYRLIYCLTKTPESIIADLKKRFYFKYGCDEAHPDYIRECAVIDRNHDISMIPEKDRIKVFEFQYSQSDIDALYRKIEKGREYYNSLTL